VPTRVLDVEITRKLTDLVVQDCHSALVLFRLHGRPLGWGTSRVTDGRLDVPGLARQFVQEQAWCCALPLAERAVHGSRAPRTLDATSLLASPPQRLSSGPLVTVAVRSRTRASGLRPCLDSLLRLDYSSLDLVLIDASDDCRQVEALVRDQYPRIRYSHARGLGTSSRRAVAECRGDILAVTGGDAVVDEQWGSALVNVFLADPEAMTVSGLVLPPSLRRPLKPGLPGGAPFCRRWWRAREDGDASQRANDWALERASSNVAHWRPMDATPARYTRVWEPAAIVRTASITPVVHPSRGRGPMNEAERSIDLAEGLSSIDDASKCDSLRVRVTWSGAPIGTVRVAHGGAVVSRLWLGDVIAQELTAAVLDAGLGLGPHVSKAMVTADLARYVLEHWGHRHTTVVPRARTAAA